MQSGYRKSKNWVLQFDTLNTKINPLMGWESSSDTMSEVKLEFQSKIQTSYRDLLKALKEDNNKPLTILDRIDTKIKERKNG